MKRISLYALIPYLLMLFSFSTRYFDVYILTVTGICTINFIRKRKISTSVFLLFFSALAFFNCASSYSLCNKSFYPLIGKPVALTCMIDSTPSVNEDSIQFTAKMISAESNGKVFGLNEKIQVFVSGRNINLEYGDKIEFKTTLIPPDENNNDGGFNYRNYLRSQDIHIICNAYDFSISNYGTYEKVNPLIHKVFMIRSTLLDKCDRFLSEDESAFLKALMLGYKSDMSDSINLYIRRSGISHIVSISGLHLAIMMSIINLLLQKLKFRGRIFIIPIINILSALFITALTGFSPSVKRAAIMLIISNSASMVYRENDSVQSLSFALLILLLANPYAIWDVRLTLSAISVFGIILLNERINRKLPYFIKPAFIRDTLSMTLSAQAITAPLCIYYFGAISVLGVFTNLVVVPLMPYIMGTAVVFMIMPFDVISGFLSDGIWSSAKLITIIAKLIALIPFSQIEISFVEFTRTSLLISFVVYTIKKTIVCRVFYKNAICFLFACVAVFLIFFPPISDDVKLTVINVGQGDCTLIQFPNGKNMLIDGGGSATDDFDTAEKIIKPHLIQNGVDRIDYAVISHFHADHAGGILNLARILPMGCIIAPDYIKAGNDKTIQAILDICLQMNIPLYMMDKGDEFIIDDEILFQVYSPDKAYIYGENDASMVFKITAYGKAVLFTGDIENYTRHILTREEDISCDILKSPHHGDYSIADNNFLAVASPEFAYICVGENNPYGHPDERTLKLYADRNIKVLRTDFEKTIKFIIKRNGKIKIY